MPYSRGYKKMPKPLGTEEWISFMRFAEANYSDAVTCAVNVVTQKCGPMSSISDVGKVILSGLLDKTASPLVYIWEEWQLLTSEQRFPYATDEYRRQLEAQIAKVQQVTQKAEEMGFAQKEAS